MAADTQVKLSYAFKTIAAYTFLAIMSGKVTKNFSLAMGIVFTYHFWNFIWIKLLRDTEHIYSVKVPTTVLPDWVQLSMPAGSELKIRKDTVVTSISELSGIRGTHMMVALRVMTAVINSLIIVVIQNDLHYRKSQFFQIESSKDYVPICLFIEIIGFFCVGHFELNLIDKTHTALHFFGVTLIFIGSLSCGFVFNWNFFSIVMTALHFGLAVYWSNMTEKCIKKSDDIKEVTRISKMCIGTELVMFNVTNLMLVTTAYASGANEGHFFVSPFLD